MNRNVSIVIAILVLVVIAGYLVWLRSRVQPNTNLPQIQEQQEEMLIIPQATDEGEESTESAEEATSSPTIKSKEKSSTSSPAKR